MNQGPTYFIYYRQISVIANIEFKEMTLKDQVFISIISGFPLLLDPLWRGATKLKRELRFLNESL